MEMEVCNTEKNSTKRSREDSHPDTAESKRVCTVEEVVFNSPESSRVNSDSEANPQFAGDLGAGLGLCSPEAKHIREDILDILDEQEILTDRLQEVEDLDSVIKSFEEEIVHPSTQQTNLGVMSSDSVDPQPDLGYLLEASDDELGLPPTVSSSDDHVNAKNNFLENVAGSEKELLPNHDSFELGLLDYQESVEFSQRPKSMPA